MSSAPTYTSAAGNARQQAHGVFVLDDAGNSVNAPRRYVQVAASQTGALLGNATGDILDALLAVPSAVNPGNITIKDGNTTISVFVAGGNVSDGKPFQIPFGPKGLTCLNGNITVTTGANVSIVAFGKLTA